MLGIEYVNLIHLRRFFGFLPGVNIKWGLDIWSEQEFKLDGVNFHNLDHRVVRARTRFSFLDAILTSFFGVFMWVLLFMYFDQILPHEFGVRRKWYFVFTKRFWWEEVLGWEIGKSERRISGASEASSATCQADKLFEPATQELLNLEGESRFLEVKKLRKDFTIDGKTLTAVNNVDLKMYENEIFVLLGHNGAGKTTLLSVLTGLIESTSGDCKKLIHIRL